MDIVDKWTNQTWWIGCTCPHMVVKGGWEGEPVGYVGHGGHAGQHGYGYRHCKKDRVAKLDLLDRFDMVDRVTVVDIEDGETGQT